MWKAAKEVILRPSKRVAGNIWVKAKRKTFIGSVG